MKVIHYTVFIAAYIIFLISKVSFDYQRTPKRTNHMARVIKCTYDTGTSLY